MPARMHKEMVDIPGNVFGDPPYKVFRYLLSCKRCVKWTRTGPNRGRCGAGHGNKAGQTLSCRDFELSDFGLGDIILETERLLGNLTKVTIHDPVAGDQVFYCDQDELKEIKLALEM